MAVASAFHHPAVAPGPGMRAGERPQAAWPEAVTAAEVEASMVEHPIYRREGILIGYRGPALSPETLSHLSGLFDLLPIPVLAPLRTIHAGGPDGLEADLTIPAEAVSRQDSTAFMRAFAQAFGRYLVARVLTESERGYLIDTMLNEQTSLTGNEALEALRELMARNAERYLLGTEQGLATIAEGLRATRSVIPNGHDIPWRLDLLAQLQIAVVFSDGGGKTVFFDTFGGRLRTPLSAKAPFNRTLQRIVIGSQEFLLQDGGIGSVRSTRSQAQFNRPLAVPGALFDAIAAYTPPPPARLPAPRLATVR